MLPVQVPIHGMRRLLLGVLLGVVGAACALALVAARYEPVVRPNTFVGPVAVGGLSPEDAAERLRLWWEMEKARELVVEAEGLKPSLPPMTPVQLGLAFDDRSTVSRLPLQEIGEKVSNLLGPAPPTLRIDPIFRSTQADLEPLRRRVREASGPDRPARVRWSGGVAVRERESDRRDIDLARLGGAVSLALLEGSAVQLPLVIADKRVPDAALEQIVEPVATFTTRYSERQASRSSNIRLATKRFDGQVLMPGERLSFNGTVGKRTAAAGYREAGIFVNGRRDTGIGGGICQVSTTLYNAALLANLKVVTRQCHSLPVPYVPLGRDAAVEYGVLDLVLENTLPHPIAICADTQPGGVTFRILGIADPTLKVEILAGARKTWPMGEKVIQDPNLPAGTTKVEDKGSAGYAVPTFRVLYRDGNEVERHPLGVSHYRGGPRIVRVGTKNVAAGSTPSEAPGTAAVPIQPPPHDDDWQP
jgi:vancomycin resistance protein YoaR